MGGKNKPPIRLCRLCRVISYWTRVQFRHKQPQSRTYTAAGAELFENFGGLLVQPEVWEYSNFIEARANFFDLTAKYGGNNETYFRCRPDYFFFYRHRDGRVLCEQSRQQGRQASFRCSQDQFHKKVQGGCVRV